MFMKEIYFGLSMLLFFCGGAAEAQSHLPHRKPNIIFILTDDLGYGDIGVFYQNQRRDSRDASRPYELTPHLDKMAASGAIFTQQYSNAPVCAPSRASLLTGVNQGNAHVRDNQFDKALEDNHNIATVLKHAGYNTIAIGKWGLQGEKEEAPYWPAHPLKRGFNHFFGYMRHRDGHEHYPVEGLYRGSKEVWKDYKNIASGMGKCYTTDLWTAYAKQWIVDVSGNKKDQPFFMYLAYDAPHAVLELPAQQYPKGGGLKGGLQWIGDSSNMINTASGNIDSYIYPEYANAMYDDDHNTATPEVPWPDTYKRYASATRRIDDAVGDILQLLKDLRIDSNTLVVFTSDNGPSIESYLPAQYVPNHPTFFASYGPFDGIKRDCWEGGLRMPTIAWWPNHIATGKVVTTPSMLSDWLATFADAARIPAPERSDGVSLLPSLTGKGKQGTSRVYVEYFENGNTPDFKEFDSSHRGRKRNQMQLIRIKNLAGVRYDIKSADDNFEIYDAVKDPKETVNLALMPGYQKIQKEMKAKVLQCRIINSSALRPYDTALIPSMKVNYQWPKKFTWKFYHGNFDWVPNTDGLKVESNGRSVSIDKVPVKEKNGLIVYEGFIEIPSDGSFDFSFASSEKAFVRLHEAAMFDADYGYAPNTYLSYHTYLQKGIHPIKIFVLKKDGANPFIQLKWRKTGEENWNDLGEE